MGGALSRFSECRFHQQEGVPSLSKVPEGCQFTACAMSEMTQSWNSLNFGKTNPGLPGSTTAAATAPSGLVSFISTAARFVEHPFVRAHRTQCWVLCAGSGFTKVGFPKTREEKSAFEKRAASVSWRGKWVLNYWNSLVSLELFIGCRKMR